jgi:hypothetical protein
MIVGVGATGASVVLRDVSAAFRQDTARSRRYRFARKAEVLLSRESRSGESQNPGADRLYFEPYAGA